MGWFKPPPPPPAPPPPAGLAAILSEPAGLAVAVGVAGLLFVLCCSSSKKKKPEPAAGKTDAKGTLTKKTLIGPCGGIHDGHIEAYQLFRQPEIWPSCFDMIKTVSKAFDCLPAVGDRPILAKTMVDGFEKLTLGPYRYITYGDYIERIDNVGSGLAKYLKPGEYALIYAGTQLEWTLSAFACWRCGATVATAYDTLGEDAAAFAINQTKATLVIADAKLIQALSKVGAKLKTVRRVVALSDEAADSAAAVALKKHKIEVSTLSEVEKAGAAAPLAAAPATSEAVAVTMYTSGTTGNPKGVMMSHKSLLATVVGGTSATSSMGNYVGPGERFLAYLPLAHIMELIIELSCLAKGMCVGYGGVGTILATAPKMLQTKPPQLGDAAAFQPTLLLAAPAVLDRIYAVVKGKIAAAPAPIRAWFNAALREGAANFERGVVGAGPLKRLIFKPVAKLLGGRIKIIGTGSAPLSLEIRKFCMTAFNCPVVQGYGLTETCGASCISLASSFEHSVGPPQEHACVRLRDWPEGNYLTSDVDNPEIGMRRGEILIGGPGLSLGYLIDPENPDPEVAAKNKEEYVTLDGVHYFCTGDIGQITPSGNIQIVDRMKDLTKLKHGEYIALSKIENVLKASRFVSVPLVHAKSSEAFCIALICPTPAVRSLCEAAGLAKDAPWAEVCANATVAAAVLADLQAVGKGQLNKFEVPQKCVLIDDEFSVENEMMTAVRKLKRKPIANKHAAQIGAVGYPA